MSRKSGKYKEQKRVKALKRNEKKSERQKARRTIKNEY
jgi:hypothetical protein